MEYEAVKYWLWLSSMSSLSQKSRDIILNSFESPEELYRIKDGKLQELYGIRKADAELIKASDISSAERIFEQCALYGIDIVAYSDSRYPGRLRNVYAAPAVLYVKGRLPRIDTLAAVSVIGTRKASSYGLKTGMKLGFEIAKCAGAVVSLLTPGAGSSAAEGALEGKGECVGVLATPLDEGRGELFERLSAEGAVISEYPPGCRHSRLHFRERNRLAAGISVAAVVVEAPAESGTRYFVEDILEQGKDVFAVPGNVDSVNSEGTINLIKSGAIPVSSGWDVMKEYAALFPGIKKSSEKLPAVPEKSVQNPKEKKTVKNKVDNNPSGEYIDRAAVSAGLTPEQKAVVEAISESGSSVDEIINTTGLSAAKVLAQLTVLEIKGTVYKDVSKKIKINYSNK